MIDGMLKTKERPRSPFSAAPRKAKYCSQTGRSRPSATLARSRSIWSASGEMKISIAAGVIAIFATVVMYRNDRIYTLANEVAGELKKVTWPTAKEVRAATMVVIVMAIVSAVILGLFDAVWSKLTDLVYGGV